jgi:thymidylate synthase (FAD)
MTKLTEAQIAEIDEARSNPELTHRFVSPGAEQVMHKPLHVLDHGFVRLVDYMGDDRSIPQAARVSYGVGTTKALSDEGLIRYLMRHWHSTPFEMCEIKLHVKLPVFVARQWIRHRTANVNEYSARYSILDREFYIPEPEHLAAQSKINNQGRGEVLQGEEAARVLEILKTDCHRAYDHYEDMISQDGQQGLARELARMNLPTNIYTQWYWKVDLHNLFHFLRLRQDPHAQYEIRVYADCIAEQIVKQWVPVAYQAYLDFRQGATQLSAQGSALVNAALVAALSGNQVNPAEYDLTGRELREVTASFPGLADLLQAPDQ